MAYNGWSNYETWACALWIGNEPYTDERSREMAQQAHDNNGDDKDDATSELAKALKDWVEEEMIPDLGSSLAADLLGAAVSEINFYEIAENYLSDLERE